MGTIRSGRRETAGLDTCAAASDRGRYVAIAATIALAGNLILAASKIAAGIFSGSLAVIGDGIDSSTDVIIAILSLLVASIMSQPSDKEHPWGHGRAETMATVILAFVIMTAGFQLSASALSRLIRGEAAARVSLMAIGVTAFSIAGKAALASSQFFLAKKSGSSMILANAKNMLSDVVISVSVLVGLIASWALSLPFLDSAIALLVGVWVMKTAVGIFLEQNLELMDGSADDSLYRSLFQAVHSVPGAKNPHRARIRKMAGSWDIDLDIEVDGSITVSEAHEIADRVERAVKCQIPDVYDIMVHVEPSGSESLHEQYGLSSKDLKDS